MFESIALILAVFLVFVLSLARPKTAKGAGLARNVPLLHRLLQYGVFVTAVAQFLFRDGSLIWRFFTMVMLLFIVMLMSATRSSLKQDQSEKVT